MARTRTSRTKRVPTWDRGGYWEISRRPLQILAFLLPLIVLYELSLIVSQTGNRVLTNSAHKTLLEFFRAFRIEPESGFYLGGIAVVVVLLAWHVLNRDPWRVHVEALGMMAIESLALALPLLMVGQLVQRATALALPLTTIAPESLQELNLWSKIAISVGAGLYEELMFRMLLIAVLHTLLVDVGKASHALGAWVAVIVSAAAFTWYHPLDGSVQQLVFFFVAGLYFGAVYVLRGFGIVVAVHALYDIITFLPGN